MDQQARSAFVIAQAACAHAALAAMTEANLAARAAGDTPPYAPEAFSSVPDQYLIGHNAVIEYLRNY